MRTPFVLVSSLLAATAAANGLPGEPVVKQARRGARATVYELRPDGGFYRRIRGNLCQVSSDVREFKIAQHPSDTSMAYYVREGALHSRTVPRDQWSCPPAESFSMRASPMSPARITSASDARSPNRAICAKPEP
jgi:hypothetical protein